MRQPLLPLNPAARYPAAAVDKLKPYLLPGVAALLYLAWWLFAPKAG